MSGSALESWGLPRGNVIGSAPELAYRDGMLVRRAVLHGPVALGHGKPEYVLVARPTVLHDR